MMLFSCTEPDTKAPDVSITSPTAGATLSEIVEVKCVASDESGIQSLEFFINNVSTGQITDTSPYTFLWNTTSYQDGASHVLKILAIDENGNEGESESISVVVDQSLARPRAIDISMVTYDTESLTILWEKSTDADFHSYELYGGLDTNNFALVATIENPDSNRYEILEFDPLEENFFRITVFDTLGLSSTGNILSNTTHDAPPSVKVTDVSYTLTEMTIVWEKYVADQGRMRRFLEDQRLSKSALNGTDFISYELLHSESLTGEKTLLATISDIDSTSYTLTSFDPSHENWFWIRVNDFWDLSSLGEGMTHEVDLAPSSVAVTSVEYDETTMTIHWDQSTEADFASYEVLHSETELGEKSSVLLQTELDSNTLILSHFDPTHENWYWIKVNDYWGLSAVGVGLTHEPDAPPTPATILEPHILHESYTIGWTRNNDSDFESYELYEWIGDDVSNKILLHQSTNARDYFLNISEIRREEELHYQVTATDYWGSTSQSNILDFYIPLTYAKVYSLLGSGKGSSIKITPDGGYIAAGQTYTGSTGNGYGYLVKVDQHGIQEWEQYYIGSVFKDFSSMDLTSDGGYILGGSAYLSTDVREEGFIVKTDAGGVEEWNVVVSGAEWEAVSSVKQTHDDGYIVTGYSSSNGAGENDMYLMKLGGSGNIEWTRYYGDVRNDQGSDVLQTLDGGYITIGSFTDASESHVWLVKMNSEGNVEWENTFGGPRYDSGKSINHTSDGGFIISGTLSSSAFNIYGAEVPHDDMYLVKVTHDGNLEWEQSFGTVEYENGIYCEQTSDGGYILSGHTSPWGPDGNIYIVKVDPSGNLMWSESHHDPGHEIAGEIHESADGGYILTGQWGWDQELLIMKTDAIGKVWLPLQPE